MYRTLLISVVVRLPMFCQCFANVLLLLLLLLSLHREQVMESLERFVMLATSNDITRAAVDHGHVSGGVGVGDV
jgi:hypothetical protein